MSLCPDVISLDLLEQLIRGEEREGESAVVSVI